MKEKRTGDKGTPGTAVNGEKGVVAEISIIPLGVGAGVGSYVRAALAALRESGLRVQPGAMATTIEAGSVEEALAAAGRAHNAVLEKGAPRVVSSVRIDERRGRRLSINEKIKRVSSGKDD